MEDQIEIGYMDIPIGYSSFDDDKKKILCDNIIDSMLLELEKHLPKHINRIDFLMGILESSLLINEEYENYEVCSVIRDTIKRLND